MNSPKIGKLSCILAFVFFLYQGASAQIIRKPIPDHLVVLTFDDAVSSHAEFVAPILKKYGFGGTFFVAEFPDFSDKKKYMTWEQIRDLNNMGFEIGNHTAHHTHVNAMNDEQFVKSLHYIENKCQKYGIPKPVSFAYPAYETDSSAIGTLVQQGYVFSRVGGGEVYNPRKDNPYLIPSFSTTGDDSTRIITALKKAQNGNIVVLTIHGVPDYAHDWVTTPPDLFKYYMKYLDEHNYTVIALRDLTKYINPDAARKRIKPVYKSN